MTSIFEGQPPKTRPFPIKTRVIWVPGMYTNDLRHILEAIYGDFFSPQVLPFGIGNQCCFNQEGGSLSKLHDLLGNVSSFLMSPKNNNSPNTKSINIYNKPAKLSISINPVYVIVLCFAILDVLLQSHFN